MSKSKTQIMHEAGLHILENYKSTGTPFALFLSSWKFDDARQMVMNLIDGRPPDAPRRKVQVRIGLERQVRIVLKQSGFDTLAVYRKSDEKRIAIPSEWPSLTFADDWLQHVTEIASLADLIVLFWGLTTDGLLDELAICDTDENRYKTVAISNVTPTQIFLHQLTNVFPRFVPLNEIPPLVGLHPEFTPLISRMTSIANVESKIRATLVEPKARVKRFPFPPTSGRFEGKMWITAEE
jgi:hypothetical protein